VVALSEKTLLLVPFHERGYSRLAEYLERTTPPVYLPLPVELCREPLLSGYLPSGLWGFSECGASCWKFCALVQTTPAT